MQESDQSTINTMTQGWDLMFNQARILAMLPLEDWLAAINRAETLGPLLDPTLWIKGHQKMDIIKEVLEACLVVKQKVLKFQPLVNPDNV